jgi:integrase
MTKTQAKKELAAIVQPINSREKALSRASTFGEFVKDYYLPFFRRKWKRSTALTNEDRIGHHLIPDMQDRALGSFGRDELQGLLDRKGAEGLSFSTVDHLRWDLKQAFEMAMAEGILSRNPAKLLFTHRECPRPQTKIMSIEEVRTVFAVLNVRERLIAKLAVLAGMRPGEIFGLKWARLEAEYADIWQRVYRGEIDSPKSTYSVRWAALSDGLLAAIEEWRKLAVDARPEAWVFPSEKLATPIIKENCWRRHFVPQLKAAGLPW